MAGWMLGTVGCETFRPLARHGNDSLENPGWSLFVKVPAGIGAIVGHTLALPFMVALLPTYPFETYTWSVGGTPAEAAGTTPESAGDYAIPLVLGPAEYMAPIGAAIFGAPFRSIEGAVAGGDPPPDPAAVKEEREDEPGTKEPGTSFEVKPPERKIGAETAADDRD